MSDLRAEVRWCADVLAALLDARDRGGVTPLVAALELAWGLIANAGDGDWSRETVEWQDAANRWRDQWMPTLSGALASTEGRPGASSAHTCSWAGCLVSKADPLASYPSDGSMDGPPPPPPPDGGHATKPAVPPRDRTVEAPDRCGCGRRVADHFKARTSNEAPMHEPYRPTGPVERCAIHEFQPIVCSRCGAHGYLNVGLYGEDERVDITKREPAVKP